MRTRLPLLLLLLVSHAAAAAPLEYTLVTSSGPIGAMTVTRNGNRYDTRWRVDDNGRGSKLDEHIEIDRHGVPTRWDVSGHGDAGAPVEEHFAVENGKARWKSLNDSGEADAKDAVYLTNDSTPFGNEIYMKLLLATKDHRRDVLPRGTLRAERLRDVVLADNQKVTAWAVWGFGLSPSLLLMRKDHLVGSISPGWVLIEDAHRGEFAALSRLAADLTRDTLRTLTAKLGHHVDGPLWIVGARVFDPVTGKAGAPTNVGVYRDAIVYVGSDAPPAEATTVDAAGATLLPGLIDSHAHYYAWAGPLDVACGVLLGRDPGNDNDSLLELLPRVRSGELMGPRIKPAGFLEGKTPFSAHNGFIVADLDEAKEKVRWYASHGYWGIKIYNSFAPELVKPVAEEAHRLGLHVSGHVPAFMSSERAVRDGYDEINHINQLMLSFIIDPLKEDTRTPFRFTALGERMAKLDLASGPVRRMVELMKKRRTTLDPTMATFAGLLLSRPGATTYVDAPWIEHMPLPVQRGRRAALLDVKPDKYPLYDASWKRLEETLVMLHRAGINLVPGTDDLPGFVLLSELEAWVKAGIPAGQVLRAATLGGARFLGLEWQLGTIEPGKLADLYLVDGDPVADIHNIRKGRLVLSNGVVYYPDEIDRALEIEPFAPRAALEPPSPADGARATTR